jgi:hypothetical protein
VVSVLTTDQKGAIAESAVAAAAIRLGIGVSRPLSPLRYDLVFDTGGLLLRVQCKWAVRRGEVVVVRCYSSRRTADGIAARSYAVDEVDLLAAYCAELDRSWLIPAVRFAGRRHIQLRLAPARNNQRMRVNLARDFEFAATLRPDPGAIAQLGERLAGSQKVAGSSPAGSIEEPRQAGLFS